MSRKDTGPVEAEPCDIHPQLGGKVDSKRGNHHGRVVKEMPANRELGHARVMSTFNC